MLGSIYNGMSSLITYSEGLGVISGNVANMNTTGFKSEEALFREAGYSNGYTYGGVTLGGTSRTETQGEIRSTGRGENAAITGDGYFVVTDGTTSFYTRNGEFEMTDDRFVLAGTDYRLCGYSDSREIVEIGLNDRRADAACATTEISLSGNLRPTEAYYEITDVGIHDSFGNQQVLSVVIEDPSVVDGVTTWNLAVKDEDGNAISEVMSFKMGEDGLPVEGFSVCEFRYPDDTGDVLTVRIGTPGTLDGLRSRSAEPTSVSVETDGHGTGSMSEFGFSPSGELYVKYSNGEQRTFETVALAQVDPDAIEFFEAGVGRVRDQAAVSLSKPGQNGLGEIRGQAIELSNVELSEEFTEMIVIQRGYQASSQILTTANEMLQTLLDGMQGK